MHPENSAFFKPETGQKLRQYNDSLIMCLNNLKRQRAELQNMIDKEEKERITLQIDVERISYKLAALNKLLSHRVMTRQSYDRSIRDIEANYKHIVELSGNLLNTTETTLHNLEGELSGRESEMNKGSDEKAVSAESDHRMEPRRTPPQTYVTPTPDSSSSGSITSQRNGIPLQPMVYPDPADTSNSSSIATYNLHHGPLVKRLRSSEITRTLSKANTLATIQADSKEESDAC